MRKFVILITGLMFSCNIFAAKTWLAKNAVVEEVWSSNNDEDVFYVKLSGQTGPCSEVEFSFANAQSAQAYSHAFSLVSTALVHNKKVNILNYSDESCRGANYVALLRN